MKSIVVPIFNESESIKELANEIQNILTNSTYELIFVDDGSTDNSFEIIQQLSVENNKIRGISLSRNFGLQIALFAGLKESKGEIVITMDGDHQHPPKVIPLLIKEYEKGYAIVNTKRIDNKKTGLGKKLSSNWYYRLINYMSETKIEPSSSDFRLMNRKAVDAFIAIPEKDRFNRGLVSWMGFKQTIIEYTADERRSGKSKFTTSKMKKLGIDGILSFSSKPLQLIFNLGISSTIIGLLYLIYVLIQFFKGNTVTGWTSTMIIILLLGGIQLVSLGIIGQYIARIYNESKNRPMYFIKDRC